MDRLLRFIFPTLGAVAAVAALMLSSRADTLPMLMAGIAAGWLLSAGALVWSRRVGVAVASLLAFGVSMYMGYHHVVPGEMVCSVNAVFDCGLVNSSKYAEIAGLPIAFLGAGFYLAVAAVAVAAGVRPDRFEGAPHLVFAGGLVSLGYTAFLAWASTQIGAWCLFCISLYGANVLICLGGYLWTRSTGVSFMTGLTQAVASKADLAVPTMGAIATVVVLIAGSWAKEDAVPAKAGSADHAEDVDEHAVEIRIAPAVPLDGTEPVLGDPAAPYTIVEFADYQCPGCAATAPLLHELVAQQPKVRVLYKYYPLSNICNENIGRLFHPHACSSAFGAECAREQGRFWEMNRLLFANQEVLDPDAIKFIASQVGVDMLTWQACLDKPTTLAAIQSDIAAAVVAGVEGTPALFVRGLYGDDWVFIEHGGPEEIAALILLKEQGGELPKPGRRGPPQ